MTGAEIADVDDDGALLADALAAVAEAATARLVEVSKAYGDITVLDRFSLDVASSEVVLVAGRSGSGKSTVLRMLLGLEQPDSGEVSVLGQRLAGLPGRARAALLRQVGVCFQDPLLDNARSVLENLTALGRAGSRFDDRRGADVARLARVVDGFGLGALLSRPAATLSGGQKLRVALGRALVARPRLLLLDEPTHMVDPSGKEELYRELGRLTRAEGLSAVIVSHDVEAELICDRRVMIAPSPLEAVASSPTRTAVNPFRSSGPPGELFRVGSVTYLHDVDPDANGIDTSRRPAHIVAVDVEDPYVQAWEPDERAEARRLQLDADRHARQRRLAGRWSRSPGTAYQADGGAEPVDKPATEWGDPVASARFFERLGSPAVDAWRTLVPSAAALLYLSDPWHADHVDTASGPPVPIDEPGRRMFSLVTDAVAIRSRGSVMARLAEDFGRRHHQRTGGRPLRWMSVACGTALPTMKAAVHGGLRPELLLVDYDRAALEAARRLASTVGFDGTIDTRRQNIFDADQLEAFAGELADQDRLPDMIDLMGIFEYTGDNLGVDPTRFLASVWSALRPGGTLILGQMLVTRPLADFTMGVVQWPYVEMRSLDQLLEITTDAGLPAAATSVYLPTDGVYAVLQAQKEH